LSIRMKVILWTPALCSYGQPLFLWNEGFASRAGDAVLCWVEIHVDSHDRRDEGVAC